MTFFTFKKTSPYLPPPIKLLLLCILLLPIQLLAQKKIIATPIQSRGPAALSKIFKKYRLFSIDAADFSNYAKDSGNRPVKVNLAFTGLAELPLTLNERNLLDDAYQMTTSSPSGEKISYKPSIKTYGGKLNDDDGSGVSLTLSEKTVYGSIQGKGRNYFIEPLRYFEKNATGNSYILYEAKDVIPTQGTACGVTEVAEKKNSTASMYTVTPGTATGTCLMVGYAIASDVTMFEKYGSAAAVEEHNISVMNTMVGIYSNAQIGSYFLQFKINGQYVSANFSADPLSPSYSGSDPQVILSAFATWGESGRFRFNYDIGQIWTTRQLGGTVGLAYVGGVCKPSRYQLITNYSSNALVMGSLTAHETGHNFNALHDNSGSPFIMAPAVTDPPGTIFSSASITAMTNYIDTISCLRSCNETKPIAAFNLPKVVCGSSPFIVTNASVGDVGSIAWNLPGATPSSSTDQQFSVQYSTAGSKIITLTATNSTGNYASSLTKQVLIAEAALPGCRTSIAGNNQLSTIVSFNLADLRRPSTLIYLGPRYTDYSCNTISNLVADSTYTGTVSVGDSSQFFGNIFNKVQIFIDYNADGDFLDQGESIHSSTTCLRGPYSFTFTTPSAVLINKTVRLRIIAMPCDLPPSDGCNIPVNAQIEDYGVVFLQPAQAYYVDKDGDGYGAGAALMLNTSIAPAGYSKTDDDCDDNNVLINPTTQWVLDQDKDNYYVGDIKTQCLSPGTGYRILQFSYQKPGDCNDTNPEINPSTSWAKDTDNDGYTDFTQFTGCEPPVGYKLLWQVKPGLDCNDSDSLINPTTVWYKDADNDGYSNGNTMVQCTQPIGYKLPADLTALYGDCVDDNPELNPATVWYEDRDGDGYPSGATQIGWSSPFVCERPKFVIGDFFSGIYTDAKLASELINPMIIDCDDLDASVNPLRTWYKDEDYDGFTDGTSLQSCERPSGYFKSSEVSFGDCDDNDAYLSPRTEWYPDFDNDGYSTGFNKVIFNCTQPAFGYKMLSELIYFDNDCDDLDSLKNPGTIWLKDADNDGYAVSGSDLRQCERPLGYKHLSELISRSPDCYDDDPTKNIVFWYKDADNDGYSSGIIFPFATCTRINGYKMASELIALSGDCNDNDATIHEAQIYYQDADGDGFGNPAKTTSICSSVIPAGYVTNSGDCNDNDRTLNPTTQWIKDADEDGYYPGNIILSCTSPGAGYIIKSTQLAGDCMDNNTSVNPGAVEVCGNKIDDDCDGVVDEAVCYTCQNANGFTTTNIATSSAQLNWQSIANPVQWQVQYKSTKQGSKWIDVLLTGNKRSVVINGLASNQNYQWQIRAKCGNTWTAYSSAISFKTASSGLLSVQTIDAKTSNEETASQFTLHPNPAKDEVNITLQLKTKFSGKAVLSLIDGTGRKLYKEENVMLLNGSLNKRLRLPSAAISGMYLVEIIADGQRLTSKLVLIR